MLRVVLLRFGFDRKKLGLDVKDANKFYRKLYGYHSCSCWGRYHHWVDGLLSEIDGKKIGKSLIMIPADNFGRLEDFGGGRGSC